MSDDEQEACDCPLPPLDPPPALRRGQPPRTATSAPGNNTSPRQDRGSGAESQVARPDTALADDRYSHCPGADTNPDATPLRQSPLLIETLRGLAQATVRGVDEHTGGTIVRQRHCLSEDEQRAEDVGRIKARRRLDRIIQAAWPLVVLLAFLLMLLLMVHLALVLVAAVPNAWSAATGSFTGRQASNSASGGTIAYTGSLGMVFAAGTAAPKVVRSVLARTQARSTTRRRGHSRAGP